MTTTSEMRQVPKWFGSIVIWGSTFFLLLVLIGIEALYAYKNHEDKKLSESQNKGIIQKTQPSKTGERIMFETFVTQNGYVEKITTYTKNRYGYYSEVLRKTEYRGCN